MAKFRTIAITEGTAKPRAHGQEATKTPIPLYITQHIVHVGTITNCNYIKNVQTIMVKRLSRMTNLTKTLDIDLQTA